MMERTKYQKRAVYFPSKQSWKGMGHDCFGERGDCSKTSRSKADQASRTPATKKEKPPRFFAPDKIRQIVITPRDVPVTAKQMGSLKVQHTSFLSCLCPWT